MISVLDHIEFLLRQYECVVVAGWGAFIAHSSSATFNRDTNIIVPPTRSISFNADLSFSDGLLENSIIRKHHCSYSDASAEISDFVASIKSQLEIDNEFAFGRLGIFKKNTSGEGVEFSPFHRPLANQNFGLKQVALRPLSELTVSKVPVIGKEIAEDQVIGNNDTADRFISKRRNYWHIAASIIILLVVSFALITPIPADKSQYNKAGIEDSFRVRQSNPDKTDEIESNLELAIALPSNAVKDNKSVEIKKFHDTAETIKTGKTSRYYLIVASASSKRQAKKYIKSQSGSENFEIIKSDTGKYRVYIAESDTYNNLKSLREKKLSSFPGAWICRQ